MSRKDFSNGDETTGFRVYEVTRKIVEANPEDDYYTINDKVHDELKKEFKYTHALRKAYQDVIRHLFKVQGRV